MSFNGSGTFSLIAGNPVVTGTTISSTTHNNTMTDVATGLSTCITKDGQTTVTANIPLATFKLTGVGDATALQDAITAKQVQNASVYTLSSVAGTNTITGSATPTPSSYASGQVFEFIPAVSNTGATTINVSSLGAKNIFANGAACVGGELVAGIPVRIKYDGTQFNIVGGRPFINQLTAETAPAIDDELALFDLSAKTVDKITLSDLLKVINSLTEDTAPDETADFLLSYDTSAGAPKKVKPENINPTAAQGASLVLLETQTASNSATVDFTTGIDSTYDEYELHIINLIPVSTNVNLLLRMDTNAGASFDAGASDYRWVALGRSDAGTDQAGEDAANTSIQLHPATTLVSTAGLGYNAVVKLFNLAGTTHKTITFQCGYWNTGPNLVCGHGAGSSNSTTLRDSAVDAIRLLMSSGNISSGTVRLYGVRKT